MVSLLGAYHQGQPTCPVLITCLVLVVAHCPALMCHTCHDKGSVAAGTSPEGTAVYKQPSCVCMLVGIGQSCEVGQQLERGRARCGGVPSAQAVLWMSGVSQHV
jgi:hypothetical protein